MKIKVKNNTFAYEQKDPQIIVYEQKKRNDAAAKNITDWYDKQIHEAEQDLSQIRAQLDQAAGNTRNQAIVTYRQVQSEISRLQNAKSRFENRYSPSAKGYWKTEAKTVMRSATNLVQALNPRTSVRWDVQKQVGPNTDFSNYNAKKNTWVVHLDPMRLLTPNKHQPKETNNPTPVMVQSCIGAAIHETCHTMYTPEFEDFKEWIPNYEQLCVFRIYEDLYINQRVISTRLPGAKPFIHAGNNWSNPANFLIPTITNMIANGSLNDFESWLTYLGGADYIADWTNQSNITVHSDEAAEMLAEINQLRQEISTGEYVPQERRAELYQLIADVITKKFPPALHNDIEQIQWSKNENGGTETPLDQKIFEPDLTEDELETLREILKELQQCSGQTGNPAASVSPEKSSYLNAENSKADVAQLDNVNDLEDVNYERSKPHEFTVPPINESRVERLRQIWKARNNLRRNFHHGLPEGKVSNRKIHRLLHPKPKSNIFKRRPIIDTASAAIMLLVDGSGSMSGDPYNTASVAAKEVMLALQGNPDYKVTVWNYTNSGNELDVVAGWTDGKNFHWPNMRGGGTPSHQAMVKAHEFLKLNYKHSPKIIVHFTDLGWGDSPTEEFDALSNDNTLDYITVTVAQVNGRNVDTWLASVKDSSPGMNVSAYTTSELVQAVQEFILKR